MEKLQVAIEQARQRRNGKSVGKEPARSSSKADKSPAPRGRTGPRLLPDRLMERWAALSEITLPRAMGDERRLVAHLPGPESSYYDMLRTKLLIELRKNGWRRVAITSPTIGCGKTTTACNLAVALMRQGELRTSLFDLDLRRPAVSHVFGATPDRDISEFLGGAVGYEKQAVRVGSSLAISMAKQSQVDPTQLIAGQAAAEILDEVEEAYAPDVMIFDLPPILAADDARSFLRNVDCAILMAQAEVTTAKEIDICERELAEQTNVLGVVLNECRFDETHRATADYN